LVKGSKDAYFSLESNNTASQNIGTWDQMMTSHNWPKNIPPSWSHWPKNPHPIFFFIFILNYTTPLVITGFEQLSSSICWWVGWPKFALKQQIVPFLKSFELGQKLGFWPIILATYMLASQSRAL